MRSNRTQTAINFLLIFAICLVHFMSMKTDSQILESITGILKITDGLIEIATKE